MEISEIKGKKSQLEFKIKELIGEFESECKMPVDNIYFNKQVTVGIRSVFDIKINVLI